MRPFKKTFASIIALLLFTTAIHAELFSSSHYGWTLDLPEGFYVADAGKDGLSYYLEHEFMKVRIAIKIFPVAQYERNDLAMEDVLNKLNADGEIDGFLWSGRHSSLSKYSFQIPGNAMAQSGWGISVTLPKSDNHMVVLCYGDIDIADDVQQFIISCIDSLIIEDDDWRKPGIITSAAFNSQEKDDIELKIGGKSIYTKIYSDAENSGRFVIDRESNILKLYERRKSWKEAWQRYYRIIFREAYSRLDDAARDIYNVLGPAMMNANPEQPKLEIAKTLLSWVQDFGYERDQSKNDFNDLTSVLQNKGSDCDSRSLLLCVLLEHYGTKSELFVSHEYGHALCGLDLPGKGARIPVDGVDYLLCETVVKVDIGLVSPTQTEISKWIGVDLP